MILDGAEINIYINNITQIIIKCYAKLTASISASRSDRNCILVVVSTCNNCPLIVGEKPKNKIKEKIMLHNKKKNIDEKKKKLQ